MNLREMEVEGDEEKDEEDEREGEEGEEEGEEGNRGEEEAEEEEVNARGVVGAELEWTWLSGRLPSFISLCSLSSSLLLSSNFKRDFFKLEILFCKFSNFTWRSCMRGYSAFAQEKERLCKRQDQRDRDTEIRRGSGDEKT